MAKITLKGNQIETSGDLPKIGDNAPPFSLTACDLATKTLADYLGQRLVLNIFPSVDTPTCATSVRTFNKEASGLNNTKVLCISADLPFAQARFCGAEGLENVETLSAFRAPDFGTDYGQTIISGPLTGLLARAVVIIDEAGKVLYTEQIAEIADEPDYAAALHALSA